MLIRKVFRHFLNAQIFNKIIIIKYKDGVIAQYLTWNDKNQGHKLGNMQTPN